MLVYALRFLSVAYSMALMAGVVAGHSVVLTGSCPTPEEGDTELMCSYTFDFDGIKVGSLLGVALQIPKYVNHFDSPDYDCKPKPCAARFDSMSRRDRYVVYKFKANKTSGTVSFKSLAPKGEYESKTKSYYVMLNGQDSTTGSVPVFSRKKKASLIRPAIGGGFTRFSDDFVNFKEVRDEDEHIFIDNDSRGRTEAMGGVLFKLHELKSGRTFDVAVNLEFTDGGEDVLDGIFVGGGFSLTPAIEVVIGYSLGRGKELSHGFQQAMGRFVEERRDNEDFQGLDLVNGVIADIRDYDGLPLSFVNDMGKREKIFPGNPITNSFNSKWSVGILIPLDFWKQIKGDDDK